MTAEASSVLRGTAGLSIAALVALGLAWSRQPIAARHVARVRRIAAAALALQTLHFCEEYATGFHLRFPEALGLAPWPPTFFVAFNVAWLAAWTIAIAALPRLGRLAAFALWFLAIAGAANGVVHPLLSLRAWGYFPGLWTSPLLGVAGALLAGALASATASATAAQPPRRGLASHAQ